MPTSTDIDRLTALIAERPRDEQLVLSRARAYWQARDIPRCLADYDTALSINPHSPARTLRQMVVQIMDCHYKEIYNP